jgi:hypothetical protein
VNALSVSADATLAVSLAIVPVPPFALKVMVAVVVLSGEVGVMTFDGAEYALRPNRLTAATTKR